MFERIDGAGVFLGVGEAAVSEYAGYGLDVGTVAQQVRSATVTGAVPSDMLLDAGASYPVTKGFQTHGVAGNVKKYRGSRGARGARFVQEERVPRGLSGETGGSIGRVPLQLG